MILRNHVEIFVLTVFITYFNSLCLGYHLFPPSNITLSRHRRQLDCYPPKFDCGDGSCIQPYRICDGVLDCSNAADEYNNCRTTNCDEWAFRCRYSACIDGDKRCDGKQDCRDGSDEEGCPSRPTPTQSTNRCGKQFACTKGGQCLPYYRVCDGIKDCSDGSDETFEKCKDTQCQDHAFRCSYGACVDGEFRCDKEQNCADGSDEDPVLCGYNTVTTTTTPKPTSQQPPLSNGFCPAIHIENGNYVVLGTGHKQGTPVPNYAIVKITCTEPNALYPANPIISCVDGKYNFPIPSCKPTCSPRISTSVDSTCTVDGVQVDCSKKLVEGTVINSKCKHHYSTSDPTQIPTSKCNGGSWDNPPLRCVPVCGDVIQKGVINVVNGLDAVKGDFPWHVGLYHIEDNKHLYKCGGSIVTPLVVISVAHCFTTDPTVKNPADEYFIGAGKYYSAYNAKDDGRAQLRQVKEYHIPATYRGYDTYFASDIAVIVIKEAFQLTNLIQPVCVDWNREFERDQLKPPAMGTVVGWGYVDPNKPQASETLKQLTAPYIDTGDCLNVVPNDFIKWVTTDKFCAGFTNGSSVCQGDSGGGMVFPWKVNNREKYYLRGLVSVGPLQDTSCDNNQYGVYTLVTHYSDFILKVIGNNPIK